MSIRLDPRRLGTLKQLAGDAGVRPGDLVRHWVEERIDAARGTGTAPAATPSLLERLDELAARVAALEGSAPEPKTVTAAPAVDAPAVPTPAREPGARRNAVTAAPAGERVALHDEMIEVLRERGPMTAAELAGAVAERGRYRPPRSTKPLDAAMVSQRVSNPTYRSRFVRNQGRIGLAE